MKKNEESRRAFLIGTAVGASAVAGAGLVPNALAQTQEQHNAADVPATTAQGHAHAGGHGAFFNDDDAVTVTAFAERIMPGAPGKPGARDADVLNYIDLALAGAYSDLQDFYRRGLAAARRALPHDLQQAVRATRRYAAGRSHHRARSRARRPASPGRPRRRSSTRCARTPWKACSPTPSMAATRTLRAGGWSASPARSRCSRQADMQSKRSIHARAHDRPAGAGPRPTAED